MAASHPADSRRAPGAVKVLHLHSPGDARWELIVVLRNDLDVVGPPARRHPAGTCAALQRVCALSPCFSGIDFECLRQLAPERWESSLKGLWITSIVEQHAMVLQDWPRGARR